MSLKVIGAGFGRTGTLSVHAALNQLGFRCYHMVEVLERRRHMRFWHRVARDSPGRQHDWDTVFAGYDACVDFPAASVWKELMEANPDAIVLLTRHPKGAEGWYTSAMKTIYRSRVAWQFRFLAAIVPRARWLSVIMDRLIWSRSLKDAMPDRVAAMKQYEAHIAEVIATVPAERLLDYTVTEGWEPLCSALDVPVPDAPFPHENDTKQFERIHRRTALAAYVLIAVLALLALRLGTAAL